MRGVPKVLKSTVYKTIIITIMLELVIKVVSFYDSIISNMATEVNIKHYYN